MPDSDNVLSSLLIARSAFGDSSEAEALLRLTDTHLSKGDVNWLEVGAGDGRNLMNQVDRLRSSRQIRVWALEPEAEAPGILRDVVWLRMRVEDYQADCPFDWINLRHSAYYVRDLLYEIDRLANMLSPQGVVALTHWSSDCILRRLHLEICGASSGSAGMSVEEIANRLERHPILRVLELQTHNTELSVERVHTDHLVGDALYDLARRGRDPMLRAASDRASTVSSLLRKLPNPTVRKNGILIAGRRPS